MAVSLRRELGIAPHFPLDARKLAKSLNINLIEHQNISGIDLNSLNRLSRKECSFWSAVTICSNGKNIIIVNNTHSEGRQSNDIMHEIAHIILKHKPHAMHSFEMGIVLRNYEKEQEEEADTLARILLLPKEALLHINSKLHFDDAASQYKVSPRLLKFRMDISGVNKIKQYSRNKR